MCLTCPTITFRGFMGRAVLVSRIDRHKQEGSRENPCFCGFKYRRICSASDAEDQFSPDRSVTLADYLIDDFVREVAFLVGGERMSNMSRRSQKISSNLSALEKNTVSIPDNYQIEPPPHVSSDNENHRREEPKSRLIDRALLSSDTDRRVFAQPLERSPLLSFSDLNANETDK